MTRSNSVAAFFFGLAALVLLSSAAHSYQPGSGALTRKVHSVKVERVPGMPGLVRVTATTIANSTGYSGARLTQFPDRYTRTGKVALQFHLNRPTRKYVGRAIVRHKAVVVIRVPIGAKFIQVTSRTNQITMQIPIQ